MSADVNYTLKRLIGGVVSDNHQMKKGFFVALVAVFGRFKSSIDLSKVLAFLTEETKVNKLMKSTEVNAAILGKLMVASAVVES